MGYTVSLLAALLLAATPARAADLGVLASCATKAFKEMNRTGKWSGKPPAGCPARVAVEDRSDGLFVTAWMVENAANGWVRTSLSAAMGRGELSSKKGVEKGNRDIMARAGRLGRCLNSIISAGDPLDCRQRADKSYLVGEETGTEFKMVVWLDDDGRHTVVERTQGDTAATPTPPADLMEGQPLPPGVIIDLHILRP